MCNGVNKTRAALAEALAQVVLDGGAVTPGTLADQLLEGPLKRLVQREQILTKGCETVIRMSRSSTMVSGADLSDVMKSILHDAGEL